MIIKHAAQVGDPVICRKSAVVGNIKTAAVKKIVKDLIDSMRYHGLVGMAAPQIGVNKRVFVSEIRRTGSRNPKALDGVRVFINPKIIGRSKRRVAGYEGCGSVAYAGLFGKVRRPNEVVVAAIDEKGKRFILRASGLLARIIQHETDHLDGKIFLNRMTRMSSLMSREEYLK